MHGVNNPELTKRLNEQVPKTMEEIMTVTTAFIRGEAAAASKKKGHLPWKSQDQPKRHASERISDFRGQSREGRGSSRFTPLTRTPKEILAAEAGKFKPPLPIVTPVEKRSSNKFCDFHNDKGHSTDECMQLKNEITFPPLASSDGTEGPLVIEAEIGGHMIHRMYIDGGFSMEVLYEHCFNQLRPEIKSQMVLATTSLTGFSGETIWPLRQLRLLVTIGDADHCTRALMNFMIVRSMSPYNGIIGRSGSGNRRNAIRKGTNWTMHTPEGKPRYIRMAAVRYDRSTAISSGTPTQYPGMIFTSSTKKGGQAPDRAKAIQAEVQKLVRAGIMREVYYHDWLSNLVMVKKHDGSWRMCVDFTDLNKACYHQIQMAELDEEKTAFHTSQGVYCYTKIPFGLKNTGATYQRLVDKAFDSQVIRNIEVYVDDLVIKSYTKAEMLRDIEETFRTLRKINMKLNPKKCTFGKVEGMFLGYTITPKGIKPCPDKMEVILQLPSPRTIKEVQSLNGKLA
ncbi:reverse transcriptase domain-containing protein, partial [Tanacetum coccineum]